MSARRSLVERLTGASLLIVLILESCATPPAAPAPTASLPPTSSPQPTLRSRFGQNTRTPIPLLPTPTRIPSNTPGPYEIDTKVDVGGRGLYIYCDGQGSPTVIFENGLGGSGDYWVTVFLETIKYTRACMYDHAGLGRSDPAPNPRSNQDMADDLHKLLINGHIPAPYLLVGHSMGGMTAIVYAAQYPQELAGVVLVDSSHPDQFDRMPAAMPTESVGEPDCLKQERVDYANVPAVLDGGGESWDFIKSKDQLHAIQSLGDLPLTVITAGVGLFPCYPPAAEGFTQIWLSLQKDYLKLSSDSKQVIAENASHGVMFEQPDTIVQVILDWVDKIQYIKQNKQPPDRTTIPTLAPNYLPFGYVDGNEGAVYLSDCKVWGWATDTDSPEADVTVRVLSDGELVASQVAGSYREDLAQTGACAGGTCAFEIPLYQVISHDQAHSILVQAMDVQTHIWKIISDSKVIFCRQP